MKQIFAFWSTLNAIATSWTGLLNIRMWFLMEIRFSVSLHVNLSVFMSPNVPMATFFWSYQRSELMTHWNSVINQLGGIPLSEVYMLFSEARQAAFSAVSDSSVWWAGELLNGPCFQLKVWEWFSWFHESGKWQYTGHPMCITCAISPFWIVLG